MFNYQDILNTEPFSLSQKDKNELLCSCLKELTEFHYKNCESYKKILDILNIDFEDLTAVEKIPFIPVRLFKEYELSSIKKDDIFTVFYLLPFLILFGSSISIVSLLSMHLGLSSLNS